MIYLSQTLLPWWLAAFALGVAIGFIPSRRDASDGRGRGVAAALVLALGAVAAIVARPPGRAGLWLETAVLASAAYGLGCLCGAAIAALFARRAAPAEALPPPPCDASAVEALAAAALAANGGARAVAPPEEKPAVAVEAPPAAALAVNDAEAAMAPHAVTSEVAAEAAAIVAREILKLTTPPAPAEAAVGSPPPTIDRPDPANADDLRLIRGVDSALSRALHDIGVWRFEQIAAWRQQHIDWIAHHIQRLSPPLATPAAPALWPPQARLLAAGALTDHARAVLGGETPAPDDATALADWVARLPHPASGGAADDFYAGARPPGFSEPPFGERDDLTQIRGVDGELAEKLNGLGVWNWRQIARWSPENARWIGAWLARPGAPERDDWVGAARALARREATTT